MNRITGGWLAHASYRLWLVYASIFLEQVHAYILRVLVAFGMAHFCCQQHFIYAKSVYSTLC